MKEHSSRVSASMVSVAVIALLLFLGPAQALVLNLNSFSNPTVNHGTKVSTTASIDIESFEILNENMTLILMLTGPKNASCIFDLNGTELFGCNNLEIDRLAVNADFGYGYGYGYGFTNGSLAYNLTINTSGFDPGNYTIKITLPDLSESSDSIPLEILQVEEKKVTICHIPPGNPANAHTITVGKSAVPAHLSHGDYLGECSQPPSTNTNTNSANNNQGNGKAKK